LREAGARQAGAFHTRAIGGLAPVLVEAGNRGHTPHFAPVRFLHPAPFRQIIAARLTGFKDGVLLAEAA
jgi:threonylcarbamoyladenosine tRNA methylthiotransferase MtaB